MATTETPGDLQATKVRGMPSVSPKQARFMAAAAHDPEFAKKAGISQDVAHEFNEADKGTGIRKKKKQPWHNKLGD